MAEQRLPKVNQDDGTWGDIIRQWLMKEHYDDGTDNPTVNGGNGGHQKITVRAGTAAANSAPIKLNSGTLMTAAEVGAIEFNTDSLYFTISTGTSRRKIAMYDDSAGATGDLYYRNSSGYFTRLPVGSNGQTLRVAGGSPSWVSGGSYTTTSPGAGTSYTVTSTDTVVFADASTAAVTITLPAASGLSGYRFYVKRIDNTLANSCSVGRTGSDTIDGAVSFNLDTQYTSILVVSNGSNWFIL